MPEPSNYLLPEKPGLRVFHKGLILVAVPLFVEIIIIGSLAYVLLESDRVRVRETKLRRCAAISAKISSLTNNCVGAMIAYLQSGSPQFCQLFETDVVQLQKRKNMLLEAASGDAIAENAARQLLDSQEDLGRSVLGVFELVKKGNRILLSVDKVEEVRKRLTQSRELNLERLSSVTSLQDKMAEQCSATRIRLQAMQIQILGVGLFLNLGIGLFLICFYKTSILQRLRVVSENTTRLSSGARLLPLVSGSDEIAQLDFAFHQMDKELRAAVRRERSLFEDASDVICVLDDELNFVKVNPASERVWGYLSESLSGQSLLNIVSPEKRADMLLHFDGIVRKGGESDIEMEIITSSGNSMPTLWSAFYSLQEKRLYCIVHDLSERKRLESMKKAFVSMMSSHLLKPLLQISGDLETLLGDLSQQLTESATGRLGLVRTNMSRLLRLVEELLQLVSGSEGKVESAKKSCSVEEILQRCSHELEAVAQKSKVSLLVECSADSWFVDANRIMQVIANLGSNAVKFSPPGSTVSFSAANVGDFVEVQVKDRGRGVPESLQVAIFEKFKQVELSDGKRKAGTGLGLPICKEIVEEHGGKIGVLSREGEGSSFWFRVPVSSEAFELASAERKSMIEKEAQENSAPVNLQSLPDKIIQNNRNESGPLRGSRLSLMKKGLILIGIPLVFELVFVASIFAVISQVDKNSREEQYERQLASCAYRLLDSYYKAALIAVRYHSAENWREWMNSCSSLIITGGKLRDLCIKDPVNASYWNAAERVHSKMLCRIAKVSAAVAERGLSQGNLDEVMPQRYEVIAYSIGLMRKLDKLIDEAERKEFISPRKQMRLRQLQGILLLFGLAVNIVLSWFLARFFGKDISSRLAAQVDNIFRLPRGLSLNPPLPGKDEIAELDAAFHASAEKLAEARAKERAVFDNSRDLACVLGADTRFLIVNPAGESLFGFSRDELMQMSIYDLLPEDEGRNLREILAQDNFSGRQLELRFKTNNGADIYLSFSISRSANQSQLNCIGHDVTERKALEEIKQDFLSVVSHDLRTPLTSVNLAAGLIEEGVSGPVGEEAKPVVHDILVQGEKLVELINDLLDLEKFEAGKMQLAQVRTAASKVLEESLLPLQERFEDHLFRYKNKASNDFIVCDSERLSQAVLSVLSYMSMLPDSEAELDIRAESSGALLIWQFVRKGKVIREELRTGLFDRFAVFTAGGEQIVALRLSPLALPLARSIIEAHGGIIQFLALEGANCCRIELPLSK